jgi:hypothetical protein
MFLTVDVSCLPKTLTGQVQMATRRISKSTVDSLFCPPGKDRDFVWDDKLKGFGVSVYPTGLKTYAAQYRKNGRSHRVVIGKHGRLTPDEAEGRLRRSSATSRKARTRPWSAEPSVKAPTLNKVAEGFLAYAFAKKKSGTARGYDNALRLHILPQLGTKRLTKITHADVESLHARMSEHRRGRTGRLPSSRLSGPGRQGMGMWTPPAIRQTA